MLGQHKHDDIDKNDNLVMMLMMIKMVITISLKIRIKVHFDHKKSMSQKPISSRVCFCPLNSL